jgi:hypothetical protein
MTILFPTLAIAFAAFCVWLTVRIVNRRERWAKWTLAFVIGVPVLYVLSVGPAAWLNTRQLIPEPLNSARRHFYYPIHWLECNGPEPFDRVVTWYAHLWWATAPTDIPPQPK